MLLNLFVKASLSIQLACCFLFSWILKIVLDLEICWWRLQVISWVTFLCISLSIQLNFKIMCWTKKKIISVNKTKSPYISITIFCVFLYILGMDIPSSIYRDTIVGRSNKYGTVLLYLANCKTGLILALTIKFSMIITTLFMCSQILPLCIFSYNHFLVDKITFHHHIVILSRGAWFLIIYMTSSNSNVINSW